MPAQRIRRFAEYRQPGQDPRSIERGLNRGSGYPGDFIADVNFRAISGRIGFYIGGHHLFRAVVAGSVDPSDPIVREKKLVELLKINNRRENGRCRQN
jgi:hypothetical protein